jgi:hypothetical protein
LLSDVKEEAYIEGVKFGVPQGATSNKTAFFID